MICSLARRRCAIGTEPPQPTRFAAKSSILRIATALPRRVGNAYWRPHRLALAGSRVGRGGSLDGGDERRPQGAPEGTIGVDAIGFGRTFAMIGHDPSVRWKPAPVQWPAGIAHESRVASISEPHPKGPELSRSGASGRTRASSRGARVRGG